MFNKGHYGDVDRLTTSQAAAKLGITRQTVLQLCESGELDAVDAGGVWLIDGDSVRRRQLMGTLGASGTPARPWSARNAWAISAPLMVMTRLLPPWPAGTGRGWATVWRKEAPAAGS